MLVKRVQGREGSILYFMERVFVLVQKLQKSFEASALGVTIGARRLFDQLVDLLFESIQQTKSRSVMEASGEIAPDFLPVPHQITLLTKLAHQRPCWLGSPRAHGRCGSTVRGRCSSTKGGCSIVRVWCSSALPWCFWEGDWLVVTCGFLLLLLLLIIIIIAITARLGYPLILIRYDAGELFADLVLAVLVVFVESKIGTVVQRLSCLQEFYEDAQDHVARLGAW